MTHRPFVGLALGLLLAAGGLGAASAPSPKAGTPTAPAKPAAPKTETIDLDAKGRIALVLPAGWTATHPSPDNPRVLRFEAPEGVNASADVSFYLPADDSLETAADIRAKAIELAEDEADRSVEKRTVLQTYKLRSGYGYYSSYTDPNLVGKKPVPNDYKTVTLGIVRPAPGIVGIVRIYCDDLAGPDFQQLHGMIENLELLGPGGGRRRAQF